MSLRVLSKQFATRRLNTQPSIDGLGVQQDQLGTFLHLEDEHAAIRSTAKLLITASTQRRIETLARHIHSAGPRAGLPFVYTSGRDLPTGAEALAERCSGFLDAAAGGSMLISRVEETPPLVQNVLLELLDRLESARHPSAAVRLISGTTVSLLDRVAAGTFSDRLFYRLNIIHLMPGDRPHRTATPIDPR
jgi:two-component system, NtrC family, response regulator AtoC